MRNGDCAAHFGCGRSQALRLGRQLAETGTLATLLPMIQQKETEELVGKMDFNGDVKAAYCKDTGKLCAK